MDGRKMRCPLMTMALNGSFTCDPKCAWRICLSEEEDFVTESCAISLLAMSAAAKLGLEVTAKSEDIGYADGYL